MAAIVSRIEADQRPLSLRSRGGQSATDLVRRQWAMLSDPSMWPFIRLFFEATALALHRRPGTEGFLDSLTDTWLEDAAGRGRAAWACARHREICVWASPCYAGCCWTRSPPATRATHGGAGALPGGVGDGAVPLICQGRAEGALTR